MYSNSIDFGDYDYSGNPNIAPNVGFNDFYNNGSQTGYTAKDEVDHIAVTRTADAPPAGKLLNLRTLLPNKTYTLSVDIWADMEVPSGAISCSIRLREGTEVRSVWALINKPVGTNRTTYSVTFTTAANFVTTEESRISLWFTGSAGACTCYLGYNIKIEEGSTATPYQPNLLDAPYYLSKTPLGENIANKSVVFPINSSAYKLYEYNTEEELIIGQTYTITLKGTKPASQTFAVYNYWNINLGSLKPVEGLTDVWSVTFTPTKLEPGLPKDLIILQSPKETAGACRIDWLKLEKGDTRTPNISQFKYFGEGLKDSNNPNDYSWDITPEYTEKGLNNTVSLTEPQSVEGLKNFADGIQIAGDKVISENDCTVYTLTKDNSQSFIDGYVTFIKHGKEVIVNGTVKFKKAYAFGVPLDDEVPDEFIARIVHGMLTGQSGTNSVSKAMYVQKDLGTIMTNSEFAANEWFTFHGNYWVGVK